MDFDTQFGLFILAVFVFFGLLIKFLLNLREKSLFKNLSINSSDVWNSIKTHATTLGLEKSNIIFGIYQDANHWAGSLIIRNSLDQDVAKKVHPVLKRQKFLIVGEEKYVITYLLTWNKEVTFHQEGNEEILAKWRQNGWFGKHSIDIPNVGTLISGRPSLDFRGRYTYSLNGRIVGLKENSINGYPKGKVAILPDSIPLPVRAFIVSE